MKDREYLKKKKQKQFFFFKKKERGGKYQISGMQEKRK